MFDQSDLRLNWVPFDGFIHHNSDKSYGFQLNVPPIHKLIENDSLNHKLLFVIRSAEKILKVLKPADMLH